MIEAFILLRLVSDYLWEYKELSVLSVALIVAAAAIYFVLKNKRSRLAAPDVLFIAFLLLVTASEIINTNNNSSVDYAKITAFFFIYIAGRLGPMRLSVPVHLGVVGFGGLAAFATAAIMGIGYQNWGSVATFSGGYFFKTDMAISALILLTLVTATLNSRIVIFMAVLFTLYIVFKTNARIALPLTLAIPVLSELIRRGYIQKANTKAILYIVVAACLGMAAFILIDFSALGLLAFDFSDPFSAANTQGRTVIWSAVIDAFIQADHVGKIIGSGLAADVSATAAFSESAALEGTRAHNSFLYLLLCTGIAGSVLFTLLLASIVRRLPLLLRTRDKQSLIISNLFSSLMLTFLWTSLTTEVIIRPQLMVLLFYFSGILVQRNLYLKKLSATNCVKSTSGA